MVLTPGEDKFNNIMSLVKSKGSWDGGDQGVLNEWRGNDWNRLSFTYNTTPTAAYTYAPAYERFGSQISALHFIGPNKPWNEIPYRAPSTASQSSQPQEQVSIPTPSLSSMIVAAPSQSYAYSSLVDRWFDVYDRNYRQQVPLLEQEFETKKYENAWNEPALTSTLVPSAPTSGGVLGLNDLRKLALEGGSSTMRQQGEAEYHSLPLEGRIDLMRPKREPPPEIKVEGEPSAHVEDRSSTPTPGRPQWQGFAPSLMQALPTPGPSEVPPSPHVTPVSLPGSGASTPKHIPVHQTGGQPVPSIQHQHQSSPSSPDSNTRASQLARSGPSAPPPQSSDQGSNHQQQWQQPPSLPTEQLRPRSPPLLSWNPAVEPPPNNPPTPSAFPADSYFPNAWDIPPSSQRLHIALTGSPPPVSSAFFEAPPPSQIPHHLIDEGHYRNVMGSHQTNFEQPHSQPDISKVTSVFPWEDKPRHTPGRVFPEGETAPRKTKYIEDMPPEPVPKLPTPEIKPGNVRVQSPRMRIQTSSPPIGFPGAKSYSNAWDSVPSIQKYASRLVKPPTSVPPLILQSPRVRRRSTSESYRSKSEQSDANSMDGDVEDEVDDDDSDADTGGRLSSSERSDNGRSRRGSKSGPMSPPSSTSRARKGYRSYGVQTVPKDVRSIAVQVSRSTGKASDKLSSKQSSASSSPMAMPHIDLPRQPPIQEIKLDLEQSAVATPGAVNVQSFIRPSASTSRQQQQQQQQHGLPTGMLSPRLHDAYTFESPNRTPPTVSPGSQTPASRKPGPGQVAKPPYPVLITQQLQPVASITRTSSAETGDSPVGPVTPADTLNMPAPPQRKPVGRAWNPATGVDVFKRGSEEVLARFLRMGSWEDDSHAPHTSHAPHAHAHAA
ncbi:hypothetical protein DFH11DRAFT_11816 [Phellopilus nigrolimitatus]|nr:hypothetical protein DFH11DRAFT_11816 [Phellopilus nigrolimitatus]